MHRSMRKVLVRVRHEDRNITAPVDEEGAFFWMRRRAGRAIPNQRSMLAPVDEEGAFSDATPLWARHPVTLLCACTDR